MSNLEYCQFNLMYLLRLCVHVRDFNPTISYDMKEWCIVLGMVVINAEQEQEVVSDQQDICLGLLVKMLSVLVIRQIGGEDCLNICRPS